MSEARSRWRLCGLFASLVIAAVGVAGCESPGRDDSPPSPVDTSGNVSPSGSSGGVPGAFDPLSEATFWLTFEESDLTYDGKRQFPDSVTGLIGTAETANAGRVELEDGPPGRGRAVRFPAPCTAKAGCPRALVSIEHTAELDPGASNFVFGATVKLFPEQTSKGSNIVQKGRFGSKGGQWKLQVDTLEGNPSCVVRSEDALVSVRSPVAIADGVWHTLSCRKDGGTVSIDVDGQVTTEPGSLGSVANQLPIRIGSPGTGDADDQFHGAVDDVFLWIRE